MIQIPKPLLEAIMAAAEAAYPDECCGLLVGRDRADGVEVTAVEPSPNEAAGSRLDSFEVSPQLRFDVMRRLAEANAKEGPPERIVGHYHSHPDHPAEPSARDLEMAFEPDLVWLIVGVENGRATRATAHKLDEATERFREIRLAPLAGT